MRVEILNVICRSDAKIEVHFASPYGAGSAHWAGSLPTVGNAYEVEIQLPTVLKWSIDLRLSAVKGPMLQSVADGILLVAQVDAVDGGSTILRLGENLVLADTEGVALAPGEFVEAKLEYITLYPFEL